MKLLSKKELIEMMNKIYSELLPETKTISIKNLEDFAKTGMERMKEKGSKKKVDKKKKKNA